MRSDVESFAEERHARGRDESVDVDWKLLSRVERNEFFQRSRYKYLFRLLEWCLVHFRDSLTYMKRSRHPRSSKSRPESPR